MNGSRAAVETPALRSPAAWLSPTTQGRQDTGHGRQETTQDGAGSRAIDRV